MMHAFHDLDVCLDFVNALQEWLCVSLLLADRRHRVLDFLHSPTPPRIRHRRRHGGHSVSSTRTTHRPDPTGDPCDVDRPDRTKGPE